MITCQELDSRSGNAKQISPSRVRDPSTSSTAAEEHLYPHTKITRFSSPKHTPCPCDRPLIQPPSSLFLSRSSSFTYSLVPQSHRPSPSFSFPSQISYHTTFAPLLFSLVWYLYLLFRQSRIHHHILHIFPENSIGLLCLCPRYAITLTGGCHSLERRIVRCSQASPHPCDEG